MIFSRKVCGAVGLAWRCGHCSFLFLIVGQRDGKKQGTKQENEQKRVFQTKTVPDVKVNIVLEVFKVCRIVSNLKHAVYRACFFS